MFTNRFAFLFTIIIVVFLALGCDDDKVNAPSQDIEGASLLGLVNGRTFTYMKTDTIITAEPYDVNVVTTTQLINVTGQAADWIISDNGKKIINLKVTGSSVIQNGFWTTLNNIDSIIYFATPPVIMKQILNTTESWSYFTPKYETDSSLDYYFFYFANFGFNTVKEYIGREEVITPGGIFNAYRFDVELYANVYDADPSAVVSEFYYPNVGLVQLTLNAGSLKRSLKLISYIDSSR